MVATAEDLKLLLTLHLRNFPNFFGMTLVHLLSALMNSIDDGLNTQLPIAKFLMSKKRNLKAKMIQCFYPRQATTFSIKYNEYNGFPILPKLGCFIEQFLF